MATAGPDARMPTRPRAAFEPLLAVLACAVLGWLAWDRLAVRTWFFADDWFYLRGIVANDYALEPGELLPWASDRNRAFDRMLKTLLFWWFGFAASTFHRIQLVLHVLTSILLFVLVRRLVPSRAAAWIAAAVFLSNRFTLYTVSWFSLLHDNLTACLSTLVLLCWVRTWQPDARRWAWLATAVVAFTLGIKAKESLILLPILVVFFIVLFRPPGERAPGETATVGLLFAIAMVFYLSAPLYRAASPDRPYFQSFDPALVARSYWWYLGQILFLPAALTDWLRELPAIARIAGIAATFAIPFTALAGAGPAARLLVFGWTMLWLGLLPTAVLPNHYNYPYYVYTPMVGGALACAGAVGLLEAAVPRGMARRLAVAAAFGLVALAYGQTRAHPASKWYIDVADESRRVMASLDATLPTVSPGTRILLVGVAKSAPFRFVSWYDEGPSNVVQSWYRDATLTASLVEREDGPAAAEAGTIVLVWTGSTFTLSPSTPRTQGPA
jgi:hypothetical protein